MMDIPHMGLVEDGTKCGHHKVCLHNSCVQLPGIPEISCPSDELALICSGHGVSIGDVVGPSLSLTCAPAVYCKSIYSHHCVFSCLSPGISLITYVSPDVRQR